MDQDYGPNGLPMLKKNKPSKPPRKKGGLSGSTLVTAVMIVIIAALVIAIVIVNRKPEKSYRAKGGASVESFTADPVQTDPPLTLRPEPEEEGFLPVFYRAGTEDRIVAITVQGLTTECDSEDLLASCALNDTRLTFFVTGEEVRALAEVLPVIRLGGHEIESRGYSGKPFTPLSQEELRREVDAAETVLSGVISDRYRMRFLRPNSLSDDSDPELHAYLSQKGYYGIARWSVLNPGSMEEISPGCVIAVDLSSYSTANLRKMVQTLHDNGYKCVTLEELFGYSTPENAGNNG